MGETLGAAVAGADRAAGFAPLAVEGLAIAPAAVRTAPESMCWSEPALMDAWEEASVAGPSLNSLGEELLEETGRMSGIQLELL